jgi:predicted RNA polymerase sigma factor
MFACAHPAIERGMRAPLILQTILGMTAEDIASAFLIPPATMGQRLVRAAVMQPQPRDQPALGDQPMRLSPSQAATFQSGLVSSTPTQPLPPT